MYCAGISIGQLTAITATKAKIMIDRRCVSELPATISENTTARRIILTTLRASSTLMMRMLMTMLLRLTTRTTAELWLSRHLYID